LAKGTPVPSSGTFFQVFLSAGFSSAPSASMSPALPSARISHRKTSKKKLFIDITSCMLQPQALLRIPAM
jgi:hypothetical protein